MTIITVLLEVVLARPCLHRATCCFTVVRVMCSNTINMPFFLYGTRVLNGIKVVLGKRCNNYGP